MAEHRTKLIGGIEYTQRPCAKCKELIWVLMKTRNFVCETCAPLNGQRSPGDTSTGGGIRVCKKDTHSGG